MDDSREEEQEAEQNVNAHRRVVLPHQVDCEGRTTQTQQVGEQVDLVYGEVVQNGHGTAEAEDTVDPVLLVALAVQEHTQAGDHNSEAGFETRHDWDY